MAISEKAGVTYWNKRKMIWFEGEEIHIDASVWAESRGISEREAAAEIAEIAKKELPGAPIHKV